MTKTSRFNYIKRGVVGVCAATLLTGLCAGTAFGLADQPGDTTVTVKTDTLQYNVTMPATTLAGALSGTNGDLTLGNLTMKNDSIFSIQLKNIAVSEDSGIALKTSALYAAATDKDAAMATIAIDGQNLDLATLKTTSALTTPVYFGTGVEKTIALTGSMKNLSATKITDTPFTFAKITWTVAPGDAPTA